jgi:hypothetical protein
LDRKWTNIIIWPRDRASISVQQLRILLKQPYFNISTPFHTDSLIQLNLKFIKICEVNFFRIFFEFFEKWQRFFEFFEKNIFEKWTMSSTYNALQPIFETIGLENKIVSVVPDRIVCYEE